MSTSQLALSVQKDASFFNECHERIGIRESKQTSEISMSRVNTVKLKAIYIIFFILGKTFFKLDGSEKGQI